MDRLTQYDAFPLCMDRIYFDSDFNCRGQFTLESVSDLAEDIRRKGGDTELIGLDLAVTVQPAGDVVGGLPDGYDYRLIAGHRRFRAVGSILRWTRIPAMIRRGLNEHEALLLNLKENLERKDLNMLQEAFALQRLYPDQNDRPLRRLSAELKRPTKWVAARLHLLKMSPELQAKAAAGLLSAVTIERLHRETPEEQLEIAEEVATARKRKGNGQMPGLPETCKRRFRDRRSKQQIADMILRMFNAGITGLPTRALAWARGELTDDELQQDIEKAMQKGNQNDPFCNVQGGGNDANAANP